MRPLFYLNIALAIALLTVPVQAQDVCFQQAGAEYGIPPLILEGISSFESNHNPKAINRNKHGSYDIGQMQINSLWSEKLASETWARITEPCVNIRVGAWILSQCIRDYGYGWKAVGCYHSRTPSKRDWYARQIASKIFGTGRTSISQSARDTYVGGIAFTNGVSANEL